MNDTSEDVALIIRERYRAMTPTERIRMASGMFETARALATAGIQAQHPDLDAVELRVALFDRLYGRDYSAADREEIVARIRERR